MSECLNCGKELTGEQKKYCSIKCGNRYSYCKLDVHKNFIVNRNTECLSCGKELTITQLKYCSGKCGRRYRYCRSDVFKNFAVNRHANCLYCGEGLIGKQSKFCSIICHSKYRWENEGKEYHKKYRTRHKQKNLKYFKEYYKKNRDKLLEKKKEYYKENKEKILKQKMEYKRKRRKNDPVYRMSHNFSRNVGHSITLKKLSKKRRHWENIVGYTLNDLKEHLEKQFKIGMTWSNYGYNGWHVDHRIPICFFEFNSMEDVEFKYCWSLNNLQPLWQKENLSKNGKIINYNR